MEKEVEEFKKKFEETFKIGQDIFVKFFELSDFKLKDKLINMPGVGAMAGGIIGMKDNSILTDGKVTRTIIDEVPRSISFDFYGKINLDYTGIRYYGEYAHYRDGEYLIKFTENFKF